MRSLTYLYLYNPWLKDDIDDNMAERIVESQSCANSFAELELHRFLHFLYNSVFTDAAKRHSLTLHQTINHAWRREICYKNRASSPEANFFPLIGVERALRRTEDDGRKNPSLGPEVLFPLLKERVDDLVNH